jgi:hypothetical protein
MRPEEIEAVLDESGLAWVRRGEAWAVPVAAGLPCEVTIVAGPDRARAEAILAEWDEAEAAGVPALALFLELAGPGLRGCRGELGRGRACLVAMYHDEQGLARRLRGVASGCRRLAREARALLSPALAAAYLAFQGRA